jgi:DNA-binding MarR family transcriptional regulator
MDKNISQRDYESLAEFRHRIRRFLRFSERAARESGLEPRQHQLLLALKGLPPNVRPKIAEIAERLQIQHHSAVELVNRLEVSGFVRRERGSQDRREVLLQLTPKGEKVLRELSLYHRSELRSQGPALLEALQQLVSDAKSTTGKRRK